MKDRPKYDNKHGPRLKTPPDWECVSDCFTRHHVAFGYSILAHCSCSDRAAIWDVRRQSWMLIHDVSALAAVLALFDAATKELARLGEIAKVGSRRQKKRARRQAQLVRAQLEQRTMGAELH